MTMRISITRSDDNADENNIGMTMRMKITISDDNEDENNNK
jgi:hypothetical protein